MTAHLKTSLVAALEAAASRAGMVLVSASESSDTQGEPTAVFELALPGSGPSARTLKLELSEAFDFDKPHLLPEMTAHLAAEARRLRNPRPDCYVTLHGLPLSFGRFGWPFHESTSGADTSLVHGEIHLQDGAESILHAKVAVSMTVTFRDVVPAPEQPFAEGFIYNAVRKTMDQGQLELVKSGNRQPVPLTTRYYSTKQKKFVFNDTTADQRKAFLATKLYWLSGVLGAGEPVWLLDPRDAQYLDTSLDELRASAGTLMAEGLLRLAPDAEYGSPTAKLMEHHHAYQARLAQTLESIKPSFNEEMRGGLTNM